MPNSEKLQAVALITCKSRRVWATRGPAARPPHVPRLQGELAPRRAPPGLNQRSLQLLGHPDSCSSMYPPGAGSGLLGSSLLPVTTWLLPPQVCTCACVCAHTHTTSGPQVTAFTPLPTLPRCTPRTVGLSAALPSHSVTGTPWSWKPQGKHQEGPAGCLPSPEVT